jgi:hypothetical protein
MNVQYTISQKHLLHEPAYIFERTNVRLHTQ